MARTSNKSKTPACTCGCGSETKGGRFLPGHDAKLKSSLVGRARTGDSKAVARMKDLGWERFLPAADPKPTKSNGRTSGTRKGAGTKAKASATA